MPINPKILQYLGKDPYADIIKEQQEAQDMGGQHAMELANRPDTDYNLYGALAHAASQMGTLGGKAADTSAVQQAAQGYQGQQDARRKNMLSAIQNRVTDAEQTAGLSLKAYQYLMDKRQKQAELQEKAKDNDLDRALKVQGLGAKNAGLNLTEGEKATDKAFAEKNAEFITGGAAKAQASLDAIDGALKEMDNIKSGPYTALGLLGPNWAGYAGGGEAAAVYDKLKAQVMATAKETLTGTMSDNDIRLMVDSAFNPNLPMKDNKKKVEALKAKMQAGLDAKEAARAYFLKRRTLAGYDLPKPTPPSPKNPSPKQSDQVDNNMPSNLVPKIDLSGQNASSPLMQPPKAGTVEMYKDGEPEPYDIPIESVEKAKAKGFRLK